MCEIAVYNPDELNYEQAFNLGFDMFQSNSDGVGALAVYRNAESFEYEDFAQAEPSWGAFLDFLRERENDDTWRVILHARLSTTGEDNDTNTHPLPVGEGSDFDWVVHNGIISNHREIRDGLEGAGHEYMTGVDSESIAHAVGGLPEDIDDIEDDTEYHLQGRLNYILCNEDGIFVRNSGKYKWTEDFRMVKRYRHSHYDLSDGNKEIKWMLLRPFDEVHTVEVDRSTTHQGNTYWAGRGSRQQRSTQQSGGSCGLASSPEAESLTETYLDEDTQVALSEDGDLIAWWEDENEKYTTDYEKYKEEYGKYESKNKIIVYGNELGGQMEADDRVPDEAVAMYIAKNGKRIDWWDMTGDTPEHGSVTVDEVVYLAEVKDEETLFDLPGRDYDEELMPLAGVGDGGNGSATSKNGDESVTVSGVTYEIETVKMWRGHYGPVDIEA